MLHTRCTFILRAAYLVDVLVNVNPSPLRSALGVFVTSSHVVFTSIFPLRLGDLNRKSA